ncbi:MAG: HAD-IC family P-type ATPase, partial [Clostridiales bacterium]|nr:HAD-IC family P-type ATPase [Clostridiales bacterium]
LYIGAPEIISPALSQSHDVTEALQNGYRVLAFARGSAADAPPPPEDAPLEPLAFLLLSDEIRPDAEETLQFFLRERVSIKLISGDHPVTVAHIARRLRLPGHDRYIDLSGLSDAAVQRAASRYTVFGRVSPAQKSVLVQTLGKAGHTVAMTGDGVNDLLALREADCSIALYNGSDAARQIAQLVLLTNDFAALPRAVMEGRRVINNMTRTASLFLMKTIYSFLLTASSALIGYEYPFQPIQLTLIGMTCVGIPAFFLSLEPNRAPIAGSFTQNVLTRAIPGGLCVFIYALGASIIGPAAGLSYEEVNTLCVYLAGTAGLAVLLRACLPLQNYRGILFFSMVLLFFGCSILFRNMLALSLPPTPAMLWIYFINAALCYPLMAGGEWVAGQLTKKLRPIKTPQRED